MSLRENFLSEVQRLPDKGVVHIRYRNDLKNYDVTDDGKYSIVTKVILEDASSEPPEYGAFLILESQSGLRNRVLEIDDDGFASVVVYGDADAPPADVSALLRAPPGSIDKDRLVIRPVLHGWGEKSEIFEVGQSVREIFVPETGDAYYIIYARASAFVALRAISFSDLESEEDLEDGLLTIDGRPLGSYFTYQRGAGVEFPGLDPNATSLSPLPGHPSASSGTALNAKAFEAPAGSNGTKVLIFLILVLIMAALVYFKV